MKIEACAARLERALMEQAKLISSKYIRPPQTADFAVMFLPVEGLYAEAVRRNGLCERLQTQYRVLVAGPNTLAALLSIILFEGIHVFYIYLSGVVLDRGHWTRALIDVGYTTLLAFVLQFPVRWWLGTYKLKKAR